MCAPYTNASLYPRDNPFLAGEVDLLVGALTRNGPQATRELAQATAARRWGPWWFRSALRSGLAAGRIRRIGSDRYAAAEGEGGRAGGGR
jgi:hypothetical protein